MHTSQPDCFVFPVSVPTRGVCGLVQACGPLQGISRRILSERCSLQRNRIRTDVMLLSDRACGGDCLSGLPRLLKSGMFFTQAPPADVWEVRPGLKENLRSAFARVSCGENFAVRG